MLTLKARPIGYAPFFNLIVRDLNQTIVLGLNTVLTRFNSVLSFPYPNLTQMDEETKTKFSHVNDRLDQVTDRIDKLTEFLRQNMFTREELKQAVDDLRSDVATKEELRVLVRSIDAFVKLSRDHYQELTIMSARVNRMEAWIQQAASHTGIDYQP